MCSHLVAAVMVGSVLAMSDAVIYLLAAWFGAAASVVIVMGAIVAGVRYVRKHSERIGAQWRASITADVVAELRQNGGDKATLGTASVRAEKLLTEIRDRLPPRESAAT